MLLKFLNGPISSNSPLALLLADSIQAAEGEEGVAGQHDGLHEGPWEAGDSDVLVSDI